MVQLNLRQEPSIEKAARAIYARLRELAEASGYHPDDVILFTPEQDKEWRRGSWATGHVACWRIIWDGGPFEWAYNLSGEESIFAGEVGYGSPGEILHKDNPAWNIEPWSGHNLGIYPEE